MAVKIYKYHDASKTVAGPPIVIVLAGLFICLSSLTKYRSRMTLSISPFAAQDQGISRPLNMTF